jgi:tetratricopeptide (TPR) repeat protein
MSIRSALFALTCIAAATLARADGAAPWIDDQALIKETVGAVRTGGILAVEKYRDRLELALAGAKQSIDLAGSQRPISFVLADGLAETIVASGLAVSRKAGAKSFATLENPYPEIGFYLASYYDETGKPAEALRVVALGLAASVVPDLDLGSDRRMLLVERGAALMALRRWQDVLDNEDRALKIDDLDNPVKARLYRGRGYALTEQGKLDDAEDAYRESLNLDPGSELAKNELRYIAGLKLGAAPSAPGNLTKVQKTAPDAAPQGTAP